MNSTALTLIAYFKQYGIIILAGALTVQTNGIPTGAHLIVLTAGALAHAGEFNVIALGAAIWLFLIIGDSLGYTFWRYCGNYVISRIPWLESRLSTPLQKSAYYFDKYGTLAVVFTRFPLSPLGPPTNILSGLSRFQYRKFLLAIMPGELMWTCFYYGLGYWFGNNWDNLANWFDAYGPVLALIICLIIIVVFRQQLRSESAGERKPKGN